MSLEKIIDDAIGREGDYVNHPADRGGPTRWGITQAVARAEGYVGDMRSYPRELAVAVYRRLYWEAPRFDAVAEISRPIAEELFDTGINMGPAVAGQMLQRTLNALGARDLKLDGQIGSASRNALAGVLRDRGPSGEAVILKALNCLQGERYIELVERRPANRAFLFGWLRTRVAI